MPIFQSNDTCPRKFLISYEKHLRALKNMRPESQRNLHCHEVWARRLLILLWVILLSFILLCVN